MTNKPKKTFHDVVAGFRLSGPATWVRELAALAFWGFSFVHLFVVDLFTPLVVAAPVLEPLVRYRLLSLLGVLAALWVLLGTQRFLAFAGYILAYPLVLALWRAPWFLFRNWPTALAFLPAIHAVLINMKLNFVLFTIALICAAIVLFGDQPELLVCAMCLLGAYLLWHFGRRLRTVFSPSTVFGDVGRGVRGIWENAKEFNNPDKLRKLEPGSKEHEQAYGQNILSLYLASTLLGAIARRLKALHETRRLDLYFVGSFLYTAVLATVIFALQYLGLSKLDSIAFSGPASFLGFLGYSFGALIHYQLSTMVPVSGWAQLLTYAELLSSILIGVLLAFVIFTSARERYRADIEAVAAELSTASEGLARLINADYELTLRAAEYKLLKFNQYIARHLLRLRSGAHTAKQIEDELPTNEVTER